MRSFCWHDWSIWHTYVWRGQISSAFDKTPTEVTETRQARICKKCKREQHRGVSGGGGSTFEQAFRLEGSK